MNLTGRIIEYKGCEHDPSKRFGRCIILGPNPRFKLFAPSRGDAFLSLLQRIVLPQTDICRWSSGFTTIDVKDAQCRP